jgi:hypothetical protein
MGPPKSQRLFGEKRSNGMSELLPLAAKREIVCDDELTRGIYNLK